MSLAMSPNWPIGSLCALARVRQRTHPGLVIAMVVGNRKTMRGSIPTGDHQVLVEGELRYVWSTQLRKLKWLERGANL